ncbi:hypothetical protein DL96DRAFT_1615243, partial [Flagelloscypha sp. PMI_526]
MTLSQDPDLWYSDGGVVLQAGNSLYRVYQGILSKQSSVFADMFSLAQSGNEISDKYEDCPLIVMYDDESEAADFLRCIFDRSYLQDPDDLEGYDHLVGVLRLSHKYNCSSLKRWTLERFTSRFFTTPDLPNPGSLPPGTIVTLNQQSLWLIPHLLVTIATRETDIETIAVEEWRDQPSLLIQFLKGLRLYSAFLQSCLRSFNFMCLNNRAVCQQLINDVRAFIAAQRDSLPRILGEQLTCVYEKIRGLESQVCSGCFASMKDKIRSSNHLFRKVPEFHGFL